MLTKTDIEKYFLAEKHESLLFLIIGIVAIIIAIVGLTVLKSGFWKGAFIPLIIIGLLQSIVGYTVYVRSDEDRKRVVYAYDLIPTDLKLKELPRMIKVNKAFVLYRNIEIVLALVGLFLLIKFRNSLNDGNNWGSQSFWLGLGIFLSIQSFLMLGADFFAEKRALHYTKLIKEFKV